ncbi:YdcF family protein [Vibrio japonicus]|uniref:YdcF family protein n=1 Tax=Vibrio japonicus TaxID=1824638 RepID=A0ABY5LKU8_9VIBR|nr:YdcF family protein [Vibrio japonicus]UUM32728.1 YdcF family protein [Vibrio japonicus]
MRSCQAENISDVILILGKRLQSNHLTAEGRSRVEALPKYLERFEPARTAIVFCGGVTEGQTRSEAREMLNYYQQLQGERGPQSAMIILEDQSQTTVENVKNAAQKIIEIADRQQLKAFNVHIVSNDYHLERILQIQSLLEEQGLLSSFIEQCQNSGITLSISENLNDHCSVPYPHSNRAGETFLALDELTVYRVYLEGLRRNAFEDIDGERRQQPYQIATSAISKLKVLVTEPNYLERINVVERITAKTALSNEELLSDLERFNKELTELNRLLDPERESS